MLRNMSGFFAALGVFLTLSVSSVEAAGFTISPNLVELACVKGEVCLYEGSVVFTNSSDQTLFDPQLGLDQIQEGFNSHIQVKDSTGNWANESVVWTGTWVPGSSFETEVRFEMMTSEDWQESLAVEARTCRSLMQANCQFMSSVMNFEVIVEDSASLTPSPIASPSATVAPEVSPTISPVPSTVTPTAIQQPKIATEQAELVTGSVSLNVATDSARIVESEIMFEVSNEMVEVPRIEHVEQVSIEREAQEGFAPATITPTPIKQETVAGGWWQRITGWVKSWWAR